MKLLKLVIVDDEPILLQGLIDTYDWKSMGFEVAGSAQSGEQAIQVIQEVKPHVVLTDIRMKQITGLMVMEEIQKTEEEIAGVEEELQKPEIAADYQSVADLSERLAALKEHSDSLYIRWGDLSEQLESS